MKNFYVLILFFLSLTVSCKNKSEQTLPSSVESVGTVSILTTESVWNGNPGKRIKNIFSKAILGLPQYEPLFKAYFVNQTKISNSEKRNQAILFVKISDEISEPKILFENDLWAKPQSILTILAKDTVSFAKIISQNEKEILEFFEKEERKRQISKVRQIQDKKTAERIYKRFGFKIYIPNYFKIDVDSANYMWISRETAVSTQAFVIWLENFTDSSNFSPENIIKRQNKFTEKYIKGPKDKSFLNIENKMPVYYKEILLNDIKTTELRGLWHVSGGNVFMGGPFITHSFLNKKSGKIITILSFIYVGKKEKRNYILSSEAVLYSKSVK